MINPSMEQTGPKKELSPADPNEIGQKSADNKHGVSPEQSQKEGPAAYAPDEGELTRSDEARKRRNNNMQRQEKAEGDRR
jgi:hypothetical protein